MDSPEGETLVGEAGQRVQAFLTHLGITRSYVMINVFLYSIYGRDSATRHRDDPLIAAYRNRWLNALLSSGGVKVVLAFGEPADSAFKSLAGQTRRNRYAAEPFGVVKLVDEPTATAATAAITVGEFVPGSVGWLGFGLVVVRRVRATTAPPRAAVVGGQFDSPLAAG